MIVPIDNPGAVYGTRIRVTRTGQPDQFFSLPKIEPQHTYTVGTPVDPSAESVKIMPFFIQPGDRIELRANTYWTPLVYRYDQLRLDQPPITFTWNLQFGVLNDDVLLTNTSAVPLTHLSFKLRIEASGQVWEPTLTVDRIDPGATATWQNAVSIPNSHYDGASATLVCDQSPKGK